MIVTIDGPAGAGKSSAARALAARLGFRFLDTGAMYRAVTWAAQVRRVDWQRSQELVELARGLKIQLADDRVLVDGEDVTEAIRAPQITQLSRYAAGNSEVRRHLVQLQREAAQGKNVVSEGRDQGTVVLPDAECKIFLTARPEVRARRRILELEAQAEKTTLAEVLKNQEERDQRDQQRECGPLVQAADAILVETDDLSADQVVDRLAALVRERI